MLSRGARAPPSRSRSSCDLRTGSDAIDRMLYKGFCINRREKVQKKSHRIISNQPKGAGAELANEKSRNVILSSTPDPRSTPYGPGTEFSLLDSFLSLLFFEY